MLSGKTPTLSLSASEQSGLMSSLADTLDGSQRSDAGLCALAASAVLSDEAVTSSKLDGGALSGVESQAARLLN